MRPGLILFLFLLAAAVSCKKQEQERAPLSRDEMVSLMMEVYLAEARISLVQVDKDSAYRLFVPYQDSLMRRRGIADSTLRKAYDYYLRHPTELEQIYDAIIDSLSLREQRLRVAPVQH